ncbi:MAG: hypothetical protein JWO97_4072 [Acidobacteria bacterium]|nr:hypothetical protein [Acidobacteriota bacterium]
MSRFIDWGPVAFGVRLGIAAAVLLLLPAAIVGVHSFPLPGDDRGLWFEPNWSLVYVIVFPSLFGGLVHIISLMRNALRLLTSDAVRVILRDGEPAADFEAYIAKRMAAGATRFRWLCISLAIILTAVHGATLARFLITREGMPPVLDWTTEFTTGRIPFRANVAFDLLAYSVECFVIFVGFFFVLKFWFFLNIFSRALRDESTDYTFNPLINDPDQRLGLRPLGDFMNLYLFLVIVFEAYVLSRRLQLVGKSGDFTLSGYVTALADRAHLLGNALSERMYQWHTIDAGLWALLIFMTLPLIVAAYFPLWTLRRYVGKRRLDLWEESVRDHDEAVKREDDIEAARLWKKMSQLKSTQLWPNGDSEGWLLLSGSVAISIAAWAPPFCAWLIGLAATIGAGKLLGSLKPSRRSD